MPAPDPDFIVAPTGSLVSVALEPAQNALNSLLLLVKADKLSGLDEWVIRTSGALTPEQRHNNRLVLIGLHYAVVPDRSWSSFPAYVDHLAAQAPTIMRDRIFNAYVQFPEDGECCGPPDPTQEQESIDTAPLLQSVDTFLEFLSKRFPAESLDYEIESEAHRYLNDPPAMQSLVVSHFKSMWEGFLAPEWDRVAPMLRASADAFQQLDLNELSKLEAAQVVLGRDLDEHWERVLEQTERLIFVPSAHVGPYVGKFRSGDRLWVLFGARIPEGVQVDVPDLSRAEILVRLNALADDTRLRILKLVSEGGEQRSQDIMARLELSQSAVSRHLKQLSATGYLDERRCEGAKCYTLNPKRIEDTLRAISVFLQGSKE
jgi:DNA-binding transcriptional ArsR family regulator